MLIWSKLEDSIECCGLLTWVWVCEREKVMVQDFFSNFLKLKKKKSNWLLKIIFLIFLLKKHTTLASLFIYSLLTKDIFLWLLFVFALDFFCREWLRLKGTISQLLWMRKSKISGWVICTNWWEFSITPTISNSKYYPSLIVVGFNSVFYFYFPQSFYSLNTFCPLDF